MLFTLEAVFARHGDALILHYGPTNDPSWVLIDGGASGVYGKYLEPRIEELRRDWEFEKPKGFPFEMVMVSHADDDHINGILQLFEQQTDANEKRQPLPFKIKRFWHNSFDDLIAKEGEDVVTELSKSLRKPGAIIASLIPSGAAAVVASVNQARKLRGAADVLGMTRMNAPFEGLVVAPEEGTAEVELSHKLVLQVLGPTQDRVDKYRRRWKKDLKAILEKEKKAAEVASMTDGSPFNLASIVVLAKLGDCKMLLTGDARGDDIEKGLEAADLLPENGGTFHVDLLKMPHHGSRHNVTQEFFERVTADHYVISGDGGHGNPHRDCLEWLAAARGDDPYSLHFTVRENAHETEQDEERRECLAELADWVKSGRPANCAVFFRDPSPKARSIHVDLEDSLD